MTTEIQFKLFGGEDAKHSRTKERIFQDRETYLAYCAEAVNEQGWNEEQASRVLSGFFKPDSSTYNEIWARLIFIEGGQQPQNDV